MEEKKEGKAEKGKAKELAKFKTFSVFARKHSEKVGQILTDEQIIALSSKGDNKSQAIDIVYDGLWKRMQGKKSLAEITAETEKFFAVHAVEFAGTVPFASYKGDTKKVVAIAKRHLRCDTAHTESRFSKRQALIADKIHIME